jgi:hypothetical protein
VITLLDDMPAGVLGVEASGQLTAEDYRDTLAPALAAATKDGGKLRVVLVFAGEFAGMDAGAVWQDLGVGIHNWSSWQRIALVTDHGWMRDGLRMFAWATPGEVKAFSLAERDDAVAWAAATD